LRTPVTEIGKIAAMIQCFFVIHILFVARVSCLNRKVV